MRSMTGYGHSKRSLDEVDIAVDIRTVNSRFFDFKARLPRELAFVEPKLRKLVQGRLSRGRIELYVELTPRDSNQYRVNLDLARNYLTLARELGGLGVGGQMKVGTLLNMPGMLVPRGSEWDSERFLVVLREVVQEALKEVVASREAEGTVIRDDLKKRLDSLQQEVGRMEEASAEVHQYFYDKLRERIQEAVNQPVVDGARLAQEVVYYAEKADISEEILRLRSHLNRFQGYLSEPSAGSVGKNLDFLCQEIHREVNTILAKSARAKVSELGLESKSLIEKVREQVQNVE